MGVEKTDKADKAGKTTKGPCLGVSKNMTRAKLELLFDRSLEDASQALGISSTMTKRLCRKFGIAKWPYRIIHRLNDRHQKRSEALSSGNHAKLVKLDADIKALMREKSFILSGNRHPSTLPSTQPPTPELSSAPYNGSIFFPNVGQYSLRGNQFNLTDENGRETSPTAASSIFRIVQQMSPINAALKASAASSVPVIPTTTTQPATAVPNESSSSLHRKFSGLRLSPAAQALSLRRLGGAVPDLGSFSLSQKGDLSSEMQLFLQEDDTLLDEVDVTDVNSSFLLPNSPDSDDGSDTDDMIMFNGLIDMRSTPVSTATWSRHGSFRWDVGSESQFLAHTPEGVPTIITKERPVVYHPLSRKASKSVIKV